MVSASADYSVRMWTINGQCVGCFGQLHSWNTSDPATFKQQTQSLPFEVDDQPQETEEVTENEMLDIQPNTVPDTPTDAVHDKVWHYNYDGEIDNCIDVESGYRLSNWCNEKDGRKIT